MRHRKSGFKLKRNVSARRALLRGLVTNIIEEERITTTVEKAKAARPLVERMITLAKQDNLHARRQAAAFLLRRPRSRSCLRNSARASTSATAATPAWSS